MLSRRSQKERAAYIRTKREAELEGVKKRELQEALQNNTPIPYHLRSEAKSILDEIVYDIKDSDPPHPLPRIAVTTSHGPSSMLKAFSKHLSLILNASHLMRGRMSQEDLTGYCTAQQITHLFIIHESKGHPSTLILTKYPHGPTYRFSLFNMKYDRRQRTFGEKVHLVVDGMSSRIGCELRTTLSVCFPAVKQGSRLVAFVNRLGTVAFRHFLIEDRRLVKECEFDMKLYNATNGTFDMDGDVEYVLNAFTNTRNEDVLSGE